MLANYYKHHQTYPNLVWYGLVVILFKVICAVEICVCIVKQICDLIFVFITNQC
jgi:hypothetical protein